MGLLVLAVLAAGGYFYWSQFMKGRVGTEDARLAGTMVDASPDISGKLVELPVSEGDHVDKGDLLFELDDRDQKAALATAQTQLPIAKAGVKAAKARLAKANTGPRPRAIRSARAKVDKLKSKLALARSEKKRAAKLRSQEAIAQNQLDKAKTSVEVLQTSLEDARQRLGILTSGTRQEDIDAASARLEQAKAGVAANQASIEQAKLALEHTSKRAPFDGVVVQTWRDVGEHVAPGSPIVTVLDPSTLHINANIEESDLADVQVGDRVDVSIDAYPDAEVSGRVDVIDATTKSQFSMTPSEGVSGAFIKVTQRIPLRIELTDRPAQAQDLLMAPGLSVVLDIYSNTARDTRPAR